MNATNLKRIAYKDREGRVWELAQMEAVPWLLHFWQALRLHDMKTVMVHRSELTTI